MAIDDSQGYDRLDRLAEEFADRFRRGERPSLKEYADRYPELADEIRELFPALVKVARVEEICHDRDEAERARTAFPPLSQVGDYRIVREIGRGGMGVVYEAEQVSLGRRVALKVLPWQPGRERTSLERFRREARASARLHHTNIVPVFEVGQDGDIQYYAMQFIQGQSLDAVIDELRRLRSRSRRERGQRPLARGHADTLEGESDTRGLDGEISVARSLLTGRFDRGPALVPGAGSSLAGPGGPVSSEKATLKVPDPSAVMPGGAQLSSAESRHRAFHRGLAHIGRQVAAALAHAHVRGILHRDVKPSNLLLDTEGVVWVSDFGLAKVDDDEITRTGDVLGTLRYMAPERFRGQGDARADLYSLGLTLYELLVLRPAFDSPDRLALSEQIKTADPARPRSIDPRIPRDLETIVLKAIEKDPSDRYASADAMAEDLRRFLDDEPIQARPVAMTERLVRLARRNPVIAALVGSLAMVLIVATIASALAAERMGALARVNEREKLIAQAAQIQAVDGRREAERQRERAERHRQQAEAERREAGRQRERAEQHLYIARIGQAEGALRLFDSATARSLLDQCRPEPGGPDRRGWEWFYLDQWCSPELSTLTLPVTAETHSLAFSPDGRMLAVGSSAPYTLGTSEFPFVPAYLISLPDGKVRHELGGHKRFVFAVTFRPDGKRLATLGNEGTIRIWDTGSGRLLRAINLDAPSVPQDGGLSWSPDGRRLACGFGDSQVRIWEPETGRETARIATEARTVAWSPDGTRIALGGGSGLEVRPWDVRDARPQGVVLSQPGRVNMVAWSPDSRRLATCSIEDERDSSPWGLTVWDTTSGERVIREKQVMEVASVAFSRDGSRVAVGGTEGIVRVFDAADGRQRAALFTGSQNVAGLAFSPDGRRIHASGWGMGGVKAFDHNRDPRGRHLRGWVNELAGLTYDREGLNVRGICWGTGLLNCVDAIDATAQEERVLRVSDARAYPRGDFAFTSDGSRLAAPTRRDRTVVGVWDVALGHSVARLRGSGSVVTAVAFRPDGQALATAALRGPEGRPLVTLWHLASGRPIRTFEAGPEPVMALGFSGDGRKLAAGGGTLRDASGWVTAWDAETGTVLNTLKRVGPVMFVAFHPDGDRLAIADFAEAKIHLWDPASGSLITRPVSFGVGFVGFTADGKRLAALGYDGNVHLADARTGDTVLVLRGFGPPPGSGGFTPRLAFGPDGSRLAAHAPSSTLNFWDLGPKWDPGGELQPRDLAGWLRRGRALAEQGDAAGAEAAVARARDIKGGDASAWIEHAVWLYRRGDSSRSSDALARALEVLPDDPGRWVDLGRMLGRLGWTEASSSVLQKARAVLERQLSRAPDDELAAAGLAEVLPDADSTQGWTILEPDVLTSSAGTALTRLSDSSVLAGGENPASDTYTVEAATGLTRITGLRLEAIPDPQLPEHGPGRKGNFHLGWIHLSMVPGSGAPVPAHLARARADYSDRSLGFQGVSGAIDADPMTLWSIHPRVGQRHWAIFQAAPPIEGATGLRLRVELTFGQVRFSHYTLGRFRLSATDRPFPLSGPTLLAIKTDGERNGLTRLGAAYGLLGDWSSAAAVLARAAARPDVSTLDRLLLALAHHHLGRHDEARSDCDGALERLGSSLADEATRDIAVEALVTTRGLGLVEAESLLLDLAFPAEPFRSAASR